MGNKAFHGPWCNLSEVMSKTGLVKNEILYFIESGEIEVTLHTDNRPFLAVDNVEDTLIGHATLRYSGPIKVKKSKILELTREGRTILGHSTVTLLQTKNIDKWSAENPFRCPLPNNIIDQWQPQEDSSASNKAILMPDEDKPEWAIASFSGLVPDSFDEDTFFKLYADEYLIESSVEEWVYTTSAASVYYERDIRFPAKALNRLKCLASKAKEIKQNCPKKTTPGKIKRTNELHQMIRRALFDNPLATSKKLWEIIREDFESGILRYDRDELIHHIDNISIEWTNSNNIHQQLKWSSFQVLISKLKNEEQELMD